MTPEVKEFGYCIDMSDGDTGYLCDETIPVRMTELQETVEASTYPFPMDELALRPQGLVDLIRS